MLKRTWVKEYLQVAHRICFNLYDPLFESEPCDKGSTIQIVQIIMPQAVNPGLRI